MEEIQEDWLIERLDENPNLEMKDLVYDSSSDEQWLLEKEREIVTEKLRELFNKPPKESEFEEIERETRE